MQNPLAHTMPLIDGTPKTLSDYAGKVVLIVNVASKCGLTPQYAGLEALWRDYRARGLVVLGFPCNQFGEQEPGSEAEIAAFCTTHYAVSFPMFAKIAVNGPEAHPLYAGLKSAFPGEIEWNFTKFLLDRQGRPAARFPSGTAPEELVPPIERLL